MSDRGELKIGSESELRAVRELCTDLLFYLGLPRTHGDMHVKINACLKIAVVLTVTYATNPVAAREGFVDAAGKLYDEVLATRSTNGPGGIA